MLVTRHPQENEGVHKVIMLGDAAGKTIEARRSEAGNARGKESNAAELEALFLGAVTDWQRPLHFIPPLPSPSDPPAPPSECIPLQNNCDM